MRKADCRILAGLAQVLGLGDDVSHFEVLKTVAEVLGCRVNEDGSIRVSVSTKYILMHGVLCKIEQRHFRSLTHSVKPPDL